MSPPGNRLETNAAKEFRLSSNLAYVSPARDRFLFYSHDGVGLGHVRRNLAIARALTELLPEASVLLATSVDEVDQLGVPPRVDVLRLPGLRKVANGTYVARRLHIGRRDVHDLRSAVLAAAVESFHPAVMLVDKHPLGASDELHEALELLHGHGGRAILGLRDILDDPATVKAEWREHSLAEQIVEHYDRVLVYGQQAVLDPVYAYGFSAEVARMTRFCGYVAGPTQHGGNGYHPPARSRPIVLATTGGGEDGSELLSAVIAASVNASWDALVVVGPQCERKDRIRLERESTAAGVEFRTFVPQLSERFASASALVCMGGYNTLVEAVASGVPTVCVPRTEPRREQLIRATAFARLGLVSLIDPERLTVSVLRSRIHQAIAEPNRGVAERSAVLDLDGARRAARHLSMAAADETEIGERATSKGFRNEAVHASG